MENKKHFKLIKAKHGWLRVALMAAVVMGGLALGGNSLSVQADTDVPTNITNQNTNIPDVATAQQNVTTAQNEQNQAQTAVNDANHNVDQQTTKVEDVKNTVANDQQLVKEAEANLPATQAAAADQQKVVADTKAAADVAQQQQNVAQATATSAHDNLANAQTAQSNAQKAVETSKPESITLPNKDLYQPANQSQVSQWNSQGSGDNNFIDNDSDKYYVDYNHLSADQNAEIQNYYGNLLNQVRDQWGTNQVTVGGQGIEGFANDVANRYEKDNWSINQTNEHDVSAISQAADDYGLATGGNYYENISWNYLRVYDNANDMNGLKKAIYETMVDMLFKDAGSHYGHTESLLGNYRGGSTQTAVSFDNLYQIHLLGMDDSYVDDPQKWSNDGAHTPLTDAQMRQNVLDNANHNLQVNQNLADLADHDLADKKSANSQAQTEANAAQNQLNDLENKIQQYQAAPQKLADDQAALNEATATLAQFQEEKQNADAALTRTQAELAKAQVIAATAVEIANSQATAQQNGYHVVNDQVIDNQGNAVQDWSVIGGHLFDHAGNLITVNAGWNGDNHETYFDQNGQPLTGLQTIDNNLYDFDDNGLAKTDVVKVGDTYYYFDHQNHAAVKDNYVQSRWGDWYMFGDDGKIVSGVYAWAGTYYYFDPVTYLRVDNAYVQSQWGDWYMFGDNGQIVSGVYAWAGTYYYFDPVTYLRVDNAYVQSQWGDWYMFGDNGQIVSGVYAWAGTYYYFDPITHLRVDNAYVQSQWGDWYMFGNNGQIVSGLFDWYGSKYYFDPVTYLKVTNTWQNLGFGWGYFNQNGQMTNFANY